jgi:uncharacterized membrane protein
MHSWTNLLFLLPAMSGPVYILVGILMWRYPPKKINSWYGYRTSRSMKSKEAWSFAQKYAAREMIRWGILLTLLAPPGLFITLGMAADLALGLILSTLFLALPIINTEKELKKRFG